jgi:hypothetical protein
LSVSLCFSAASTQDDFAMPWSPAALLDVAAKVEVQSI